MYYLRKREDDVVVIALAWGTLEIRVQVLVLPQISCVTLPMSLQLPLLVFHQ